MEDFKNEFSLRKVGFADCSPRLMYTSRFGSWAIPLLVYRLVFFIFSTVVLVLRVERDPPTAYYFFTVWSYTLIVLYFLLATIVSFIHTPGEVKRQRAVRLAAVAHHEEVGALNKARSSTDIEEDAAVENLPWYMSIQWLLYNISLPTAIFVTILYWGVLYPLDVVSGNTPTNDFLNVGVHILNAVFMLVEQYVSAIPSRILHFYQPLPFGLAYVITTAILYVVEGLVIYKVLDWGNIGPSIGLVLGILLYYIVAQFVLYFIDRALTKCSANRCTSCGC